MEISKYKSSEPVETSPVEKFVNDFFIEPSFISALTYLNIFLIYFLIVFIALGKAISPWLALLYFPLIYILSSMRRAKREKDRLEIAHRIPQFADALANALSLGTTLEQAFKQATFYLRGKIQTELNLLVLKNSLGKNFGVLLRDLDEKFPNTGFVYLISLLEAYSELGVGISPLLKKISAVIKQKEKAEEKIRTILAGGSGYAKLTIIIFIMIFALLGYLLRKQITLLFSPSLQPILIFLCVWMVIGIMIVTRITSLDFARNSALSPYLSDFKSIKKMSFEDQLKYSGIEWTEQKRYLLFSTPLLVGFCFSYLVSLFNDKMIVIMLGFGGGCLICWGMIRYLLRGLVEDQLLKIVETFPEILQIFSIGLNSGLNVYLAFEFSAEAITGKAPRLLMEELTRTRFAMECGEDPSITWQRLAAKLPIETVVDFCDIMVVAPMHGESIVDSINHMINSYQEKKLTLIEKKATMLSQLVIPVIIGAFFPLFLFIVFAPLVTSIINAFK